MIVKNLKAAVLSVVLVPGLAAAGEVKTDFDHDYDFSKVKTFATKIGTGWGNPLSEKRVSTEITEALVARGWKAVPEGEADALVVLHGAGEKQKTLNTFYSGMGGWATGVGAAWAWARRPRPLPSTSSARW